MIQIYIPDHFIPERKYSIHLLFDTLLNANYELNIDPALNHTKIIAKSNIWIFQDAFFKSADSTQNLYSKQNLPSPIKGSGSFENLVLLYGENEHTKDGDLFTTTFDITGSIFFMASRWEEMLGPLDRHDRFIASNSIAYKFNFLDKLILHEYAAWFKKELNKAGFLIDQINTFKKIYSCDVDYPFLWDKSTIKKKISGFLYQKILFKSDPYFVFDQMMDDAEKQNLTMQFNFLSGGKTSFDNYYNLTAIALQNLFQKIKNRGHEIGLHGSYNSYNNLSLLQKEKSKLEDASGIEIKKTRQHFLRFKNPETWQIQDSLGFVLDSSMGFADQPGFRCGMCIPFPVFDLKNRKMLQIKEQPLILMDATLRHYLNLDSEQAIQIIDSLMHEVRAHGGEFVFLWHNSSFYESGYRKLLHAYRHLLEKNN